MVCNYFLYQIRQKEAIMGLAHLFP